MVSFSASLAVAVQLILLPRSCGLARSAARSISSGGLFGAASTTNSAVWELSPSGLWLLSRALTSMVWEPISCSVVVQVQLGMEVNSV